MASGSASSASHSIPSQSVPAEVDGRDPSYLVFDDYRATERILVWARWVILLYGLYAVNARPQFHVGQFDPNNWVLAGEIILNIYLHSRVRQRRRLTLRSVLVAAVADYAGMVTILMISGTPPFANPYFVALYPIALGYSLVLPRGLALAYVVLVALTYAAISLLIAPGVDLGTNEAKVLVGRVITMVTLGVFGNLLVSMERELRLQAVDAEWRRTRRNLELLRRAQQAELEAQEARSRIAREIHDGIAQSIYILSLNLETIADLVSHRLPELEERLDNLVRLSRQTLLETRHYIFDLKGLLSGDTSLAEMLETQGREFKAVTSIPVQLIIDGNGANGEADISPTVSAAVYRIAQEALSNVYKHAQATRVGMSLSVHPYALTLRVEDDGRGFEQADVRSPGYGLENMRQRAGELGGRVQIESRIGQGTSVTVELPLVGTTL